MTSVLGPTPQNQIIDCVLRNLRFVCEKQQSVRIYKAVVTGYQCSVRKLSPVSHQSLSDQPSDEEPDRHSLVGSVALLCRVYGLG